MPSDGVTADSPESPGDADPLVRIRRIPTGHPLQIVTTGLLQDLDADLGVTAGTMNVPAWANQVSAGEDFVVTAVGTITSVENAINGHAALDFKEGNSTTAFASLTNGDGLTWFAVVEPAATQDTNDRNQIFGWIHINKINSGITAGVDRDAKPYAMIRPASTEFKAQSTTSATGWTVLAGRLAEGANANVQLFRNSSTADAMVNATAADNPVGARSARSATTAPSSSMVRSRGS